MEDIFLEGEFRVPGSEFLVSLYHRNSKLKTRKLLCVLVLVLSGCDLAGSEAEGEPEYVVESYQIAGELLQPVYLSRAASVEESYDFFELAVSGAEVHVERLNDDGGVEQTYSYRERPGGEGAYVPEDSVVVQPLTRYRLVVQVPEVDESIEAQTVVPDTFSIVSAAADTMLYQGDQQLTVRLTRSEYPGRQEVYQFTSEMLDPRISRLTPFYRNVTGSDSLAVIQEYRKTSSPLVNAANYGSETDPSLTMRMPWLMFAFYGPNEITVHAVDDNLYDFLRSQVVQQGGPTTLGPGEIPSILEYVEGGTGVFGSYARVSVQVYVQSPGS